MDGLNQNGVYATFATATASDRQRREQLAYTPIGCGDHGKPAWKPTVDGGCGDGTWTPILDAADCRRMRQEAVTKRVSWRCVIPPAPIPQLAAAIERGATQRRAQPC